MFFLFPKWLLGHTNSPGSICQGVKDTVLGRKVVVSVPKEVLVYMGGFLYTEVSRVLLGPGETRVSKRGMKPLLLGTSLVN